jgi:hypothetical protein
VTGHTVAVLSAPGNDALTSAMMALSLGARTYLVPAAALPYLGRGLDPSLFDLTALQGAERGGRLPVTLHYHGGLPALPGVTITHAAAGTAAGYLTGSSAARFGAALARQWLADHARASYGTDGLFANGLTISLPGARPAPARARPAPARASFPMHTLTVTGTDVTGAPDTGDAVFVVNVTSFAKFGDPVETQSVFDHGTAKFSVPSGTYWAFASFVSKGEIRLDVLPQFTVSHNATVHLSALAASSRISMVTPRPSASRVTTFTLFRTAGGSLAELLWFILQHGSLWVSPTTAKPATGSLQTYTFGQLISPPGQAGVPYAYNVNLPGPPGIIPPQHFVVSPASLATVSNRYFQERPTTGTWETQGGTPRQIRMTGLSLIVPHLATLPGRQTLYDSASPATAWSTNYSEFISNIPGRSFSGQFSANRLYHAGEHLTENWNEFPLHPGPNVRLTSAGQFPTLPSASRAKNRLTLDITPFSDNQPGHLGSGLFVITAKVNHVSGTYAIYQDGTKIAGGDAVKKTAFNGDLFVHASLSPRPSLIRFTLTASRASKPYRLSATSSDVWTWRSRPEPTATVPAAWYCHIFFVHGKLAYNRHCAVQQMLTLRYHLAGLDMFGSTAAGHQELAVTATALQLAAPSPVTAAQVQVSFDGGHTWHRASVAHRAGAAGFTAGFTAPAGHLVSLRVAVATKAGATLTETILGAYQTRG